MGLVQHEHWNNGLHRMVQYSNISAIMEFFKLRIKGGDDHFERNERNNQAVRPVAASFDIDWPFDFF